MKNAMSFHLFVLASFAAWVYLTLGHGRFWRGEERLRPETPPAILPEVVVIIPARDEAESIDAVISAHLGSLYPGKLSVILVDDHSQDGTATIARAAAERPNAHARRPLHIIETPPLPEKWTGKLWAVQTGLDQIPAIAPDAKYVLLTDADIVLAPDTLTDLVTKSEREKLMLASLMARLDSRGWGAFLIPAFIYFFQMLYPFGRANDTEHNLAAAAGGCMLVRNSALQAIDGVKSFRSHLIDDCALARAIKDISPTTKIWIGLADEEATSLRDNRSLESIWNMVARTAYTQLSYSPFLLAGTILGMALLYLAPVLAVLVWLGHGSFLTFLIGLSAWALMAMTYWPTLKLYKRPPWETIALPFAGVFYAAMTITSAIRHWRGEGGKWKGRTYKSPA